MKVKAKEYMYYNRREYFAGDEYEMDDREEQAARLLALLGKIEIINIPKDEPKKAAPQYQATAVKAEEPKPAEAMKTEDAPDLLPVGPRRYYRRRDLKAEE